MVTSREKISMMRHVWKYAYKDIWNNVLFSYFRVWPWWRPKPSIRSSRTRWRMYPQVGDKETPSVFLTICEGNPPVDSPHKGSVMRSLDIFIVVKRSKLLTKQPSCRWLETPWRSSDVTSMIWVWYHIINCVIKLGWYLGTCYIFKTLLWIHNWSHQLVCKFHLVGERCA